MSTAVGRSASGPGYRVAVPFAPPGPRSRWLAVLGILLPLKLLAALPVLLVYCGLRIAQGAAAWFSFWGVLLTGRTPAGLYALVADILRLQTQLMAWLWSFTDGYPTLGLGAAPHAVTLDADPPAARARWLAVLGILMPLKVLLAIPHVIIVCVLGIVALVLGWISFWIVLIGGAYPAGLLAFNSGVLRWQVRLTAYLFGLADEYPPFSLA